MEMTDKRYEVVVGAVEVVHSSGDATEANNNYIAWVRKSKACPVPEDKVSVTLTVDGAPMRSYDPRKPTGTNNVINGKQRLELTEQNVRAAAQHLGLTFVHRSYSENTTSPVSLETLVELVERFQ